MTERERERGRKSRLLVLHRVDAHAAVPRLPKKFHCNCTCSVIRFNRDNRVRLHFSSSPSKKSRFRPAPPTSGAAVPLVQELVALFFDGCAWNSARSSASTFSSLPRLLFPFEHHFFFHLRGSTARIVVFSPVCLRSTRSCFPLECCISPREKSTVAFFPLLFQVQLQYRGPASLQGTITPFRRTSTPTDPFAISGVVCARSHLYRTSSSSSFRRRRNPQHPLLSN